LNENLISSGKICGVAGPGIQKPENATMYWRETLRQMINIGIGSLIIIAIISVFIGAVTAVQFSYQMEGSLIPRYYIGYIVRDMTIMELAPTFSCMVLPERLVPILLPKSGVCVKKNT
jgi:phospholipid/cholesterol/gamma-HCH transport system permease protein